MKLFIIKWTATYANGDTYTIQSTVYALTWNEAYELIKEKYEQPGVKFNLVGNQQIKNSTIIHTQRLEPANVPSSGRKVCNAGEKEGR